MADIVGSLFGLSVPQLQEQRRQSLMDENQQAAMMQAKGSIAPGMTYAQAMLGRSLGQAIGQGLFGVQDPMIERATKLEGILKQTQDELGADASDPFKLYNTLSLKLGEAGFNREAIQAKQLGGLAQKEQVDLEVKSSQIAENLAKARKAEFEKDPKMALFYKLAEKSSPEAVRKAVDAGYDFSLLDSPDKQKISGKAQELVDSGLTYGTPDFNKKMNEYIESDITGKKKGSGNVTIGTIDTGANAKKFGEKLAEQQVVIQGKYDAVSSMEDALNYFDKGIYAGGYGKTGQFVAKYSKGVVGSLDKVQNTENFINAISTTVIPLLKEFGGNDSNEELKFLQNVVGGNTELEPGAIKAAILRAKKKTMQGIKRIKNQTESGKIDVTEPDENTPVASSPKATRRWNAKTGQFEVIK